MDYEQARDRLVADLVERADLSEQTADAMRAVPRHEFVPESRRSDAYEDRPLPIGNGQTISAPHMVGVMLDLLAPDPGDRILEIGTGCGYHAAVTAEVVGPEEVFSVEYYDDLAARARETLDRLGYGEISVRAGDGRDGWADHAPYDAAYLTCAGESFPPALVEQVRPGGVVLGPIDDGRQRLVRGVVGEDGLRDREGHGYVRFVPLQ
ncbi:protein-L-isoaspartate(D-aspartate) O-methyltransferase [Halovenus sp. WSH3]|uniref:Protein-L-isoaspartate O-methyltransferase n=1 Tax=Halovenus carboxidivorans TaxID=2692199 RepID=A0A6B0TGY4_9EURY|nr:protein-L-isoaspartate(D-aspartate) O-methyltransferase [Halovenus carboxidivorans]MXR52459.1 protein-L-isoaspartate(D-aspartate) O-methyltransferase [Halovenus carboxidivorans]